jgi:hypothetical protein
MWPEWIPKQECRTKGKADRSTCDRWASQTVCRSVGAHHVLTSLQHQSPSHMINDPLPKSQGPSSVARFGIGGAFHDPGSIDPDQGSGTRVDRYNLLLGRDPIRYVSILVLILSSLIYIWAYLGLLISLILSVIFRPINILNFKHHILGLLIPLILPHRSKQKWIAIPDPTWRTRDVYPWPILVRQHVEPRSVIPFLDPNDPVRWQLWAHPCLLWQHPLISSSIN